MKAVRLTRTPPVDRVSYIIERCRAHTVLHLGCVDHPFLDERLARGELLHAAIAGVARSLVGLDLDADGIQRLRAAGFADVRVGDVEHLEAVDLDQRFEVIVAGELVEHLSNPGLFLTGVQRLLADDGALLVTVPNASSLRALANTVRSRERVHPDHKAYYSPVTLTALLEAHGLIVEELRPYWAPPRAAPLGFALYDRALRLARGVSPWLGEGLVAIARPRGPR